MTDLTTRLDDATQLVSAVDGIRARIPSANLSHLDTLPGASVYVRDSERIAAALGPSARVLDWGCGYGQMSWLLAKRGYTVTAADVTVGQYDRSPLLEGVPWLPLTHPVAIDLPDASFDAVVASGTLEHVDDMPASLRELRRVLKPNGHVFMFRFPNLHSYIEWAGRRAGLWHHAIRLTRRELAYFARVNGLEVISIAYETILPVNCMCSQMRWFRPLRSRFERPFTALDQLLVRTPGVARFSTSMRAVLRKSVDYGPA